MLISRIRERCRSRAAAVLRRVAGWLRLGGRLVASFGSAAGDWSGDRLRMPMHFSHNDPDLARLLVERVELLAQDNEDARFLWISARRS